MTAATLRHATCAAPLLLDLSLCAAPPEYETVPLALAPQLTLLNKQPTLLNKQPTALSCLSLFAAGVCLAMPKAIKKPREKKSRGQSYSDPKGERKTPEKQPRGESFKNPTNEHIEKGGEVEWVKYYKGFGVQDVHYPAKNTPDKMYYWLPGTPVCFFLQQGIHRPILKYWYSCRLSWFQPWKTQ